MASGNVQKVSILGKDTIHVGYHLIPHVAETVLTHLPSSTYVLVTDTNIAALHLPAFEKEFGIQIQKSKAPPRFLTYVIPPGEQSKSRSGKAEIEDFLLESSCTRDTVILAVGGGVIGDLVGFVAATFMRGVRFCQVPTTLLAMVDSSVGGKTAIDTPHGKNLIGSFWQPEYVFIDAGFLTTLPPREFANGMAEVIKTAAIWNQEEFTFLESQSEEIHQAVKSSQSSSSASLLIRTIVNSVSVKAHIVTIDERETGLRNLVNFGHSIGHAIEAVVTPSVLHGECVSVGMVLEAEISRCLGHLGQVGVGRLTRCLKGYGLPVSLKDTLFASLPAAGEITVDRLLHIMKIDKKNSGSSKKIVLLSRIGATVEPRATIVDDSIIRKILSEGAMIIPSIPRGNPVVMATPGSKSISNRAMVLAALGQGTVRLRNLLHSDDTQVMMTALSELKGAKFTWEDNGETLVVEGGGGSLHAPPPGREIYLQNAGTAARFLTTVCTLAKPTDSTNHTVITGNARMKQRPIGPLVDALRNNACKIDYKGSEGCLPLAIQHGLKGGLILLEASVSSQYVSSILLCAPYASKEVKLELIGGVVISQPYIDMTIAMMASFGINVRRQTDLNGNSLDVYFIPRGTYKNPETYVIESDASSATYPLAIAAITGTSCTVSNIGSGSLQGDARFAKDVLEPMGCTVKQSDNETTVTGPPIGKLKALGHVDMEPMTDAFLTASVLAAVAVGEADSSRLGGVHIDGRATAITGIANQRVKECNRIRAMIDQLAKFGIETKELDDGLTIYGKDLKELKSGASVHCYDDHRVAMAFSVLSSVVPNTTIEEKRCVEKTWPNWWDDLVNKIGLDVEGVEVSHHPDDAATSKPSVTSSPSTTPPFPSIILIGLRGAGKTHVGRLAARALNFRFIDADKAFEDQHGSLGNFVAVKGWPAFRAAETQLLDELISSRPTDYIISLGGGIVETPAARDALKRYAKGGGSVVYIVRDLDEVVKYLAEEPNRPAYGDAVRDVCVRRIPWLEECSTHRLTVNDDIPGFFGKIVSRDLTPPSIVVPGRKTYFVALTYPDVGGAASNIAAITAGVDAVELRVDLLSPQGLQVTPGETNIPPQTYVADQVSALRGMTDLPILYTVRTKAQGGAFPDDKPEEALNLLKLGLRMRCELVDVEVTLPLAYIQDLMRVKLPSTKIVASWHDWQGSVKWNSSTMRQKYTLAASFGDIVKLVGKAHTNDDNLDLANFVKSTRSSHKPKPIIAMNIGAAGQLSRILNETLTPVSHPLLPSKAAPGQLSFADIQRALTLLGQNPPKKFYLFGTPIAHSPSPLMHNTGFETLGLPYVYNRLETREVDGDVEGVINESDFGGASVTIPHKVAIIPYLDTLSEEARVIGAVNTIIPRERGLHGDNTDWLAIRDLVSKKLEQSLTRDSTALVIGAGGTSRAAVYALHVLGVEKIYLFNRTRSSAQELVDSFPAGYNIVILEKVDVFPGHGAPPSVIIGTVPASATTTTTSTTTRDTDKLLLTPKIFIAPLGGVVVDMAYKPSLTPLLSLTPTSGRKWKIVRGVDVLIEQGCRQFELWTGRRAPRDVIRSVVLGAYKE